MKKLFLMIFFSLAGLAAIASISTSIRQTIAKREIEAEWLAEQTIVPPLAKTSRLEIVPLYEEARAADAYISGHGVSYLIRTDSGTVLLDIGNNRTSSRLYPSCKI